MKWVEMLLSWRNTGVLDCVFFNWCEKERETAKKTEYGQIVRRQAKKLKTQKTRNLPLMLGD